MIRTLVLPSELYLPRARMEVGRVVTSWVKHLLSVNQLGLPSIQQ